MVNSKAGAGYSHPDGSSQPNANCFDYPSNTWVRSYHHVHVGSFGTKMADKRNLKILLHQHNNQFVPVALSEKLTINLDPETDGDSTSTPSFPIRC